MPNTLNAIALVNLWLTLSVHSMSDTIPSAKTQTTYRSRPLAVSLFHNEC